MMKSTNNTTKPFYNTTIPSDWEAKKGVEISDKITKGSSPNWQGFQYQNDGVLFVTSENVRDGLLDISEPKYLPFTFNDKLKNSILQKGDILINIVGASIGRSCIYNIETVANINQAVCILRLKDTILREYISYYLQLPKSIDKLLNTQSDSARPNLTLEDIRNFQFLLPPLSEQHAIAHVLGLMDAAINKNNQLIAQKELQKKWLMQNLLTGKKRLKGFGGEWKKERLEKYLVKHDEKSTSSNQFPVLTSSRRGIFLQSDYYTRDVASEDNTGYNVVPRGYFTYRHMSDDLIFKFNVNDIVDKGIVSTLYPVFTVKNIDQHFLLSKLNEGNEFKIHAQEQKQGGSRTYVYFKTLCQLKLYIPSLEEQAAIAQVRQAADKEIQLLKAKTDKLREQKKGMMQVLLTGKKRLKIKE
ncbi:MAG: restriction endonuclease subunit S [Prolixibacteraceae bacterium]|nr:restriction endonuclease subunit S [Prolixibacteraceae bacterium]